MVVGGDVLLGELEEGGGGIEIAMRESLIMEE